MKHAKGKLLHHHGSFTVKSGALCEVLEVDDQTFKTEVYYLVAPDGASPIWVPSCKLYDPASRFDRV